MTLKKILILILFFQNVLLYAQITENIYIHTDKSSYHVGEILWLSANVVDGDSFKPIDISNVIYAELLDTSGNPLFQFKIGLKKGSGYGSFEIPSTLHTGRYLLTAYTSWMKNFSPEYYFYKEILLFNTNDSGKVFPAAGVQQTIHDKPKAAPLIIYADADKKQYKTREKITVNLSTPASARLSVSVYKIDSLQQAGVTDIAKSLSFPVGSDAVKYPALKFPPELNGHIITGRIINTKSGQATPGITGYLSVPGKKQFVQISTSDSLGRIVFEEKDLYGVDEIVVQTDILTDSIYHIELDNPFSLHHITPLKDSVIIAEINPRDRGSQAISAMVQDIYSGDLRSSLLIFPNDSAAFYGRPAADYKIEDYVKFTTMEDVLREYVTQVGIRKKNGKLFPFIYDQLRRKPFINAPLYLVDGVPVFEVDRITTMNPLLIRNVEVVDSRFFRGKKTFEGIVSISTKNADFEIERNARLVNYGGMLPMRKFNSPIYESEEQRSSRMPDFRNVLYWSPEVISGNGQQKIEIYSSDIKGTYAIVIQGVSANGEAGSKSLTFVVE